MRALLTDIAGTAKPDFVINTGDMTEGTEEQGAQYMSIFKEILGPQARQIAVMGNHDRAGKPVMDGLYGIDCAGQAAHCNYSFDYGKWHFVVVHNGVRDMLHRINRDFLRADLAAAKDRPTLLFYHVHVLCPTAGQAHLSYMGDKRYAALGFLSKFPHLRGCFAGHDHAFWHGRFMDKNFFGTVGSWYQCGRTKNGWWWFHVDGEDIRVKRKEIGGPAVEMPDWKEFPPHPTAAAGAVEANGRLEMPLFTERLTGAGFYWGTQGRLSGAHAGVKPAAGEKMICCMELNSIHQGVLGCRDFEVKPGDRLAYWMFVPPGCEQWTYGLRPARGWKGFKKLKDQNGLPAYVNLKKAGISPGNWLYREIPLGRVDTWFSTFTALLPGRYASWPTTNLRASWRLFVDEVRILRTADAEAPGAAAPGRAEGLKADEVGAGCAVLTWDEVKGAHHYRVERIEGRQRRFVGTSNTGRFFDFTVEPGKEYTYEVAAVNARLKSGAAQTVQVETKDRDPTPPEVAGLRGALLPTGRFVFAGTWHRKPAVHISWDAKPDLNDPAVKAYRVYRVAGGQKTLFAQTIGRYALVDEGKLGDRFAVAAVNHVGEEGPASELEITETWKGPGQAFHLRTGEEDSAKR